LPTPRPRRFTLRDIFDSDTLEEKTLKHPCWMKDSRRLSYLDSFPGSKLQTIWILDTECGERRTLFDPTALRVEGMPDPLPIHAFTWSPNETTLLLCERAPARFSPCGNLFLVDVASGTVERLTDTELDQRHAKFSPDGSQVGFVRGDNLWTLDLGTREERQWTYDAGPTTYNGRFGWVYEEELGLVDGWAWSPDGTRIAYFQQDESLVPEVLLPDYDDQHMKPHRTRYPRAGDPNSTARIGVLNLATGETRWMRVAPDAGDESYPGGEFLIARMQWTPRGDALLIQRMNRIQNRLDVLLVDPSSGESRILLTETDAAWVDIPEEARFVGEDRFLLFSERDGWRHVYLYGLDGSLVRQLTRGEWDVESILSVDEPGGAVYVSVARPGPTERNLHRVALDPGDEVCLTDSTPGWNEALFAPDSSRFVHTHSTLNQPARVTIRTPEGGVKLVVIESSSPNVDNYSRGEWELLTITTAEGDTLNARLMTPRDFDPSKRYPVLMNTYGGPGSQVVRNRWAGGTALWNDLLAQQGYAVMMVDNRGTGFRGAAFKKRVYQRLGQLEVADQIAGARWLANQEWVNPKRIGIWGWSYGGLMASLCMMLGADVFRAGVAVAPVSEWALYDSIYTERYMRLPSDNPEGYQAGSPTTHADKLRGRFLLVHGLLDDNVHFQNAARLAGALHEAKRHFQTMFYPGKRHGIEGRHFHLYMTITEFLRKNL
jgi:dipeptidyl-peptidase-4